MWRNKSKKKKDQTKEQTVGYHKDSSTSRRKLDESIENSKAVVILNGKPIFGTIKKVNSVEASGKVFVTMLTQNGETLPFEATAKLANDEFKLISDEVYETLTKGDKSTKNSQTSGEKKARKIGANNADLSAVKKGDVVETMILSGRYQGIWVKSEVSLVEDDTMDLRVMYPKKWKVAGTALAVPNKFIRTISEKDLGNYVVPVEFALDDSKLYLSCNNRMRIKHLKTTVSQQRGVQPNQLIFVNKGTPLLETDPIPDDAIFCIVCQKGGLTSNQMNLLSQSIKASPKSKQPASQRTQVEQEPKRNVHPW